MSETLEKLRSVLIEQLGACASAIDLDSPLQSLGFDDADLEELKILIEETFKLSIAVIEEEHHEIDFDNRAYNLKDLTARQLADWIDGWINRDEIHPLFHRKHSKTI